MGSVNCNNCQGVIQVKVENCQNTFAVNTDLQTIIREFRQKHVSKSNKRKVKTQKVLPESSKDTQLDGYKQMRNGNNLFMGYFQKNCPEGEGLMIKNQNEYYCGNFKKGKPHKRGYQKTKQYQFQGSFENGKFQEGLLKTKKFIYKGSFNNNQFDGKGSIIFHQGDSFQGNFRSGKFHGPGQYVSTNGKYVGMFRNGKYHGMGIFYWNDGSVFQGQYSEGVKQGLGRYIKGDYCFEGTWKNGKPSQKGQNMAISDEGIEEQNIAIVY